MTVAGDIEEIGLSISRAVFAAEEIAAIRRRVARYLECGHRGVVTESDRRTLRAAHGLHLYDSFFGAMTADARLLGPSQAVLKDVCYVHQSKINVKRRIAGAGWPWHQDFVYWKKADSIPEPRLLNVGILLDDVDLDNGPIALIPRSHALGDLTDVEVEGDSGWEGNVSENLTYQVGRRRVDELLQTNGLLHFTGQAGDVLFFDPMMVHSSSPNLSSRDRSILIITYNAISNRPAAAPVSARPEFLCSQAHTPLRILSEATVLSYADDARQVM